MSRSSGPLANSTFPTMTLRMTLEMDRNTQRLHFTTHFLGNQGNVIYFYQQTALTSQLAFLGQSFTHHNTFIFSVSRHVDFSTAYLSYQDRHTEISRPLWSSRAAQFVTTGTAFPLAIQPLFHPGRCPSPQSRKCAFCMILSCTVATIPAHAFLAE
ncbi:hypothetical protein PoB_006277700 [Plakobranchus ocellatus]|uniref:Uncharacterized protein n=1 Tax=Plakobranchus ocellatus TaxID=259542 RepID=A0AAV4CWI3_9GAST|nr:hypothetical protein PoB_006277700 [Plakobranchus ocellatus]